MMANVAKYNRDDVIHKAMLLFWEKGYNSTSTRDLQQAIDMRPGSIYAAFGSKEQLYREALVCYSQGMAEMLGQRIVSAGSPLGGLEAFFRNVVIDQCDTNPSEVCMLVKTLTEVSDDHPELMELSRELLKRTEDRFADILQQAKDGGEIAKHANPRILARHLQVQMIGLRIYMKTSRNPDSLSEQISTIFANIKR
ncbi:TetR/AcrR family transcriptional regulator [Amphritea sp. 2_MG-2023]|uniref:TetR/AcrR family transcriptional regulator n=1 Tax=Amphritea TaxID=515417 RepID=UPI001C06B45D|nr:MULTISPECIES: TetR/AcrR family transcriptional regulator [Amphritea]MBU2963886.1 TetR/AcrR family transcriptional regulator [Amphritea atlantica]MDO6419201.1 TetR/AcrR family transcriptional regulator [Amphritea sp. 2_MG-2023]